jgi:hypothetical protein
MRPIIVLLLRLYPARWRARYGDEFAAVLEERPLGPFDVADILLGALDAHLHLRGLGAAPQHQRGFAMSLRIGGYAAIVGGLLWFIALAFNAINAGADSGAWWIGIVIVIATVMTLVALIGLSTFQARRHPVLTWAAFAIPAAGAVIGLFGFAAMVVLGNSDAIVGGMSVWAISSFGLLTLLVGSGLFALATWRARSLSRAAAALLAVGAIGTVPALTGLTGGLVPSEVAGLVLVLCILAFPAGWTAMGVSALRAGRPVITPLEGASA